MEAKRRAEKHLQVWPDTSTWVADDFTEAVLDSTLAGKNQNENTDLFMVEIMEMK